MSEYYVFLTNLMNFISNPLTELSYNVSVPLLSALVLGLVGATSPCQLSTNLAALGYVSRGLTAPHRMVGSAVAYLLGKVTVYTLVGGAAILLGLRLDQMSIPVIVFVRKALGPLLIVMGLLMIGLIRLKVSVGFGLSQRIGERVSGQGLGSSYLLGLGFSLAFCPTLFWLFFGLVIPMGASWSAMQTHEAASAGGLVFPAVFTLGTTIPLLFLAGTVALGVGNGGDPSLRWRTSLMRKVKRWDARIQRAIGVLFILIGINEIALYWFV